MTLTLSPELGIVSIEVDALERDSSTKHSRNQSNLTGLGKLQSTPIYSAILINILAPKNIQEKLHKEAEDLEIVQQQEIVIDEKSEQQEELPEINNTIEVSQDITDENYNDVCTLGDNKCDGVSDPFDMFATY